VSRVEVATRVPGATVEAARELWYDVRRWPTFVDGFGRVVRQEPAWPDAGTLVWQSTPHGRGRVIEHANGRVEDERLVGRQEVTFAPAEDGVEVTVRFDYELRNRTPVTPVVDRLFIRRAVRDALGRTLRRYAIELEAEVSASGGR
jgi:hypothetical protein